MKEQRRELRTTFTADLEYIHHGDAESARHQCTTVDISKSGLGIISDALLVFGQFIEFQSKGPDPRPIRAVVQWSMPLAGRYRSGLFLF